jgi:phage terminase large subunit-like protein
VIPELVDATFRILDRPQPQPHQRPPEDPDWDAWVLAAGRGAGKSFASMHWLAEYAKEHPNLRARVIAPTFAVGVGSCVEGDNGLLHFAPEARWLPSAPGGARVEFPNGSCVWIMGTPNMRDADKLRGITNISVDVFEEAAANPQLDYAFEQAKLSRRGSRFSRGVPSRWVATTTPRPLDIMRGWRDDPSIHYVRVPSSANKYLTPEFLADLEKDKGSRRYRQEVLAEILDDVEGALWTLLNVERSQIDWDDDNDDGPPSLLVRGAIGIDPPSGHGTCGIVATGATRDNHVVPWKDYSVTDASPNAWASMAVKAYEETGWPLVAEINQGGKMVAEVMRNVRKDIPIKEVRASVGKVARAEPIAVLWEADEQIGHFLRGTLSRFGKLIDQMTGWVDGMGMASPDEMDAFVWAAHHLRGTGFGTTRVAKPRGQLPGM